MTEVSNKSSPILTILVNWIFSRFLFYFGAILTTLIANPVKNTPIRVPHLDVILALIKPLTVYADGSWYQAIGVGGYAHHALTNPSLQVNWAFFPALPVVYWILGNAMAVTVFINLLTLIGLIALYRLLEHRFDAQTAMRSILLICYFPFSYSLSVFRPEGMMLAFWAISLLLIDRRRYAWAALAGALAALCKPNGLMIAVPIALDLLLKYGKEKRFPALREFLPMISPAVAVAAFSVYVYTLSGNFLAWAKVQRAWGAELYTRPKGQVLDLLHHPMLVDRWGWDPTLFNWCAFALVIAATAKLWKRDISFALFLLATSMLSFLNFGVWVHARQMTSVFPLFVGLALMLRNGNRERMTLQLFASLLMLAGAYVGLGINAFLA